MAYRSKSDGREFTNRPAASAHDARMAGNAPEPRREASISHEGGKFVVKGLGAHEQHDQIESALDHLRSLFEGEERTEGEHLGKFHHEGEEEYA